MERTRPPRQSFTDASPGGNAINTSIDLEFARAPIRHSWRDKVYRF
jgi:hypothetical protein